MASNGGINSLLHRRNSEKYNELNSKINEILIFDKDIPPNATFTFVDFASNYKYNSMAIEQLITSKVCKKYCDVVERANIWLSENINWRVIGCETVNATVRITNDLEYHDYDKEKLNYLTPLILFRLWLRKRDDNDIVKKDVSIIQRIKYFDFIPQNIKDSQFENLDSLIIKINEKIKNGEINGQILNIQTYPCEAGDDWSVDPEDTTPKFFKKYVFIIRVFYEIGSPCEDEIGFMDFVPECQNKIYIFSAPKFESQSDVFKRCSIWLSANPELIICNVQTVEYKINSRTKFDTKYMSFSQNKSEFIRIIRVAYRKPPEIPDDIPQSAFQPPPPPVYLASKAIVLDRSDHRFDEKLIVSNIGISKNVIANFFSRKEWNANEQFKWKFLNIETTNLFAENEKELESRLEKSFRHYNTYEIYSHNIFVTTFYVATIYFDVGYYGSGEIDVLRAFKSKRKESFRYFSGNYNYFLENDFRICKIPLVEWQHLKLNDFPYS